MSTLSYVGRNTSIKGDFGCGENLLLEGAMEGRLRCNGTIIGAGAVIHGEIAARVMLISGGGTGTIRCLEKLRIYPSA